MERDTAADQRVNERGVLDAREGVHPEPAGERLARGIEPLREDGVLREAFRTITHRDRGKCVRRRPYWHRLLREIRLGTRKARRVCNGPRSTICSLRKRARSFRS